MRERKSVMTKEKLIQLKDLRTEIREIDRKIAVIAKTDTPIVKDRVKASEGGYPYIEGHTTISGHDEKYEKRRVKACKRLVKLREERRLMAEELETEIEEYIGGIENSRIRLMFQYRYVDGLRSCKVGELMDCDRTTVEKTINKYLREHP
jgi:DNA-directed RNA polymerase specialized sigma24 family protein